MRTRNPAAATVAAALALAGALTTAGAGAAAELPRIVERGGRHALLVDGTPFLVLGGQAHNSSNYPAALPRLKDEKEAPAGTASPGGGVAIAQIGADEFVLVGQRARVRLAGTGAGARGKPTMFARVEEGRYDAAGKWVMERNWNGDQTDYGLNLPAAPTVLRVRMGTLE